MNHPHAVAVVGRGNISRVHPAFARKRKNEGRWKRPRGHHFRLRVLPISTPESHSLEARATAETTSASGPSLKRRTLWKLVLYGSGPLYPENGFRHSDGRTLRGALLALLDEHFGTGVSHALSNHSTTRKSPIAVSLSRSNPRRAYVTLLANDDLGALQLLRELEALLRQYPVVIGTGGPGTHTVKIKASLVSWVARGTYLDVATESETEARRLVPGQKHCAAMPGRAGKRAELLPFKVMSARTRRLPVQVGPMASYGYGVLA